MHKPNHLFFTAEEVRIRAGLNGVCKMTVAFVVVCLEKQMGGVCHQDQTTVRQIVATVTAK